MSTDQAMTLCAALSDVREAYVCDAALPEVGSTSAAKEKGPSFWDRINPNGWVAAAIGLVVAFGVVVLIVLAGRGAGGPGIAGTSAPVIPEDAPYAFVFEDQVAIPMEGIFWEHGNIGREHEYQADGCGLPFELTDSDDPPVIRLRAGGDAAGLQFVCRTGERVGSVWLWDADRRMIEDEIMNDFSNLPEILDGKPGVYYVSVSIYRETATRRGEYCESIQLIIGSPDAQEAEMTETAVPIETGTLPGTPIIVDPRIDPYPIVREELPELTTLPESSPFDTSYTSDDGWCEGWVIGIMEDGRYLLHIIKDMYLLLRITDETQVDLDLDSVYWDDIFLFSYDTVDPPEAEGQPSSVDALIVKRGFATEKPVIYLYPTVPTVCSVRVDLDGRLTCTYPDHGRDGWHGFTAHPDGTLVFPDGREYYCLYWEGMQDTVFGFSSGFCVRGEDTAAFLADALPRLGLTAREANEMIIYWLPRMQDNAYNVISFQTSAYVDTARLDVTPASDTVIRVFMAWYGTDAPVDIPAQELTAPARDGFVLVEWGGAECR